MTVRTILHCLAICCGLLPGAAVHSASGDVTEERVLAESSQGENWFLKGGNFRGEHFSPLNEINDKNVDDLGLAWVSELPVPDGIAATPIVVDGVIYLSGAYSVVFAIDASNGSTLWTFDAGVRARLAEDPGMSWTARANRGVAVWHGKVFVTTPDCWLIALNATTGNEIWSEQTCDPKNDYGLTDSPYVGGDNVFVGTAGSETPKKTRGYVSAYDADSGEMSWRFFIVPSDDPKENDTPALKMAAKTWSQATLAKHGAVSFINRRHKRRNR